MPMNPRLLVPRATFDPDAAAYLRAVEAADGQALETPVKRAVDDFFRGTKADGTFSALKAACILCGARTLAGALVPLVGTAPTNVADGFVAGDYTRGGATPGLQGDGTSYLDSGRSNDADPRDDNHNAIFISTVGSTNNERYIGSDSAGTGVNTIGSTTSQTLYSRTRCDTVSIEPTSTASAGFCGTSRATSDEFSFLYGGIVQSKSVASEDPDSLNIVVFGFNNAVSRGVCTGRLCWYSIGEALDLEALDARVTALVTAIGAAV
jgi:hypothetical protein